MLSFNSRSRSTSIDSGAMMNEQEPPGNGAGSLLGQEPGDATRTTTNGGSHTAEVQLESAVVVIGDDPVDVDC